MKKSLFFAAMILGLLSCNDNGTKNGMQKDTVVTVDPPANRASGAGTSGMDTMNAGSTINGGTNSSGATNMNSSGTTTTSGSDTSKNRNNR